MRLKLLLIAVALFVGSVISYGQYWDGSAISPTSGAIANITSAFVSTQGINNGTTTLITNASVSTGYTTASGATSSGTFNFGAACKTGVLSTSTSTYFTITLTPSTNYKINLASINFGSRGTGTGPTAITVYSSIDSYATAIGSTTVLANSAWAASNITLTGTNLVGATSTAVTLRIYGSSGVGTAAANTANWRIDDVTFIGSATLASAPPDIALANNGTQVTASNVNQGTSAHVLHKFQLGVTTANASLTGVTCTTTGSYLAADITNLKVRYSADATLDGADATLSTLTNPGAAGAKTFPSFTAQAITSATTGYIFITADVAASATHNNTISVSAIATGDVTFTSGNKSGSTTVGGAQTFKDVTAPTASTFSPLDNATGVAVATNLAVTFNENIVKGTGNILIKKVSDNSIVETIDVTNAIVTISGTVATINPAADLTSSTEYYIEIPATAFKDAAGNFYLGVSVATAWSFTTIAPTITSATTALSGFTYTVNTGPSANQNFTVSGSNLSANLLITTVINYEVALNAAGPFVSILSLAPTSGTVAPTTIYVRLISGIAIASYNEQINMNSTNALTQSITLSGTVTPSASSDVVYNSGSSTSDNTNILSGNYQGTTLTSTASSGANASVGVMGLYLRDGGTALTDNDGLDTELTAITFTVTNAANIKLARLFDGNTPLGVPIAVTGGNTLAFSGLSILATDGVGAQKAFNLRLTFNSAVTDNDKMVFTVSSVTANPAKSTFAAANGGAAYSDNNTGNDINRIEVTATKIIYGTQPASTSINTNLSTFSVKFVDDNSNPDFDTSRSVTLTASNGGVNMTSSASYSLTPTHTGIISFTNVQFTTGPQTNITITATTTGLGTNTVVSDPFSIADVPINSYRTIGDGTWSSTAGNNTAGIWEQLLSGTGWTASSYPSTSLNTNKIYIYNNITLNGNNTAQDLVIGSGGVFNTFTITPTFKDVLVEDGGTFKQDGYVKITGVLEVKDGGTYQFNSRNTSSRTTTVWAGTEKFHPNSTFKITDADTTGDYYPFETEGEISTYTDPSTGYIACFGNIIIDNTSGGNLRLLPTPFTKNLTHGDITFKTNSSTKALCVGNCTTEIGGDFIIETAYNQTISLVTTGSTVNLKVKGNIVNNSARILRFLNYASGTANVTVEGDIIINSGTLDVNFANGGVSTVNLKGDLTVSTSGLLTATATTVANNTFNFTGTGNGLSAATTQTIDVASTGLAARNQYFNFNVNTGAYVQLANRNLELGINSTFTVNGSGSTGGTMDFGFSGTTPLNLTSYSSGSRFESKQASTLKITSTSGISATSGTVGNVQVTNVPSYDSVATFHYIGKNNQVTGTGLPAASSAKIVIVELLDNTKTLTLTGGGVGISNTTTLDALGGKLDIRKGTVIGTTAADFSGSGRLVMSDGEYKIGTITATPASNYLPQLSNYANYSLTGGIVNLNSTAMINGPTQILSGVPTYYNLKFSGSNILSTNYKGISSATSVANAITISETAIVDVKTSSLGGSSTSFTMENSSRYITDGGGLKPDAGGVYTLGTSTTIDFANSSAAANIRLTPDYARVIVSGSNVSNNSLVTGIKFQPNGDFRVTSTGTFKLLNTAGFCGVPNGAISTVNNPQITLDQPGSIVEYAGANQTLTPIIIPDPYCNLVVSGTGTKTIPTNNEIWTVNDFTVNASAVKIESGASLMVTNKVFVDPTATMTIETNDSSQSGSLIQVNDIDTNDGKITYERRVPVIRNTDYTFWSSPVSGQDLFNFSVKTPTDKFYTFDAASTPEDWKRVTTSTKMTRGLGYCVYGEQISGIPPAFFDGIFVGKPNNGLISVQILWNNDPLGTSNLIGNPYPSAIDADEFLFVNKDVIEGTIYFWTHNTDLQARNVIIASGATPGAGALAYTSNDYASYNSTGGTTGSGESAISDPNHLIGPDFGKIPNGKIAAGQAFFTTSLLANGNVIFNNSMRLDKDSKVMNNSQFFKTRNPKTKTTTFEKHRIWLNLTNTQGAFKQTLVGYITDATNQYDNRFDGETFDGNEFVDFYSINQEKNLVIQGRALPFDENDQVPLGFRTTINGDFTIKIDQTDGVLTNQAVFIEDKLTNTIFDLRSGPFTFKTFAGTFNDRFVLRYTDKTLGTNDLETLENQVLVSNKNKQIKINSNTLTIDKVAVYDLLGRLLFKKDKVNSNELSILHLISNAQTLLVKVTLQNGQTVTKKIIF